MRKLRTFLMTLLFGASISYANAEYSQVNFEAGYRRDNIKWGIDFPDDSSPFFETSSRFKDMDIFQIGVNAKTTIGCNFYARGSANWGWILNGDFEESVKFANDFTDFTDFSGIDTLEFSRTVDNIIDDRYVIDFNVAIGYPFYFCDCMARISPVIGYAYDEQNVCLDRDNFNDFSITDGLIFPVSGSDCCCDKFISRWYGPFLGVDFDYNLCDCWSLYAQVEYHFARFKGKRHTHGDFSFAHHFDRTSRHAHGWLVKVGALYDFYNCWTAGFNVSWTDFHTSRHHNLDDSSFFSDFSEVFSASECCNDEFKGKHSWRSFAFNVTVGYQF